MAPILTSLASIVKQYGITSLVAGAGAAAGGLTATGGIISDYEDSGTYYRAHIFTSSGTFEVEELGAFGDTVEYLVVAGGGGGGNNMAGGGGGGGLRTNLPGVVNAVSSPLTGSPYAVSIGPYTVTVGAAGASSSPYDIGNAESPGGDGGASNFYPTPVSFPSPTYIRADGGGGGGGQNQVGNSGGSGGGGNHSGNQPGGTGNSPPYSPPQGNSGGSGLTPGVGALSSGGGGGGAGQAGINATSNIGGPGGAGVQVAIAGPPTFTGVGALNPGPGEYQWFAGGGGGGAANSATVGSGGVGGGGTGGKQGFAVQGTQSTGGGGGGGCWESDIAHQDFGAAGGSGIVIVRYQIAQLTASAKATGGSISYYDGMTIHTFTSSGTFTTESNWTATDVEYVIVGGGGAGSAHGGGGAGAYRTGTTPIGAHPVSTTIQVGAGGANLVGNATPGKSPNPGTPSYFGTPFTSPGGGGGGKDLNPGATGGSGGGGSGVNPPAAGSGTGDPFPGTIGATPANGWGNDGGAGTYSSTYTGGGGGGAGGLGIAAVDATYSGSGGAGIQLPSTFRDPSSTVGAPGPTSAPTPNGFDTSGKYWVAGGGSGGYGPRNAPHNWPGYVGGGGGAPAGAGLRNSYAGAGIGGYSAVAPPVPASLIFTSDINASENTGSGGGGGLWVNNGVIRNSGNGGSGIVLIAYPS